MVLVKEVMKTVLKRDLKTLSAERRPFTTTEERSDRGRKLAPSLPFLHTQWAAGEHTIASLYQALRAQGYPGSETAVRNYLTALREQIGPQRRPRRYYPPIAQQSQRRQRPVLSSRRATWLILRKPEDLSGEEQSMLTFLRQAHQEVRVACELAQVFVQMVRKRNASALEPWLKAAIESGIPELRTFATGIKRDQTSILAALMYE